MELLGEVFETSFALLSATWTVAHARRFLRGLDYTHVIVRRAGTPVYYYLYTKAKTDDLLHTARAEQPLWEAFDLHEDRSTVALEGTTPADEAPDRTVVLEQGNVVGFFDVTEKRFGDHTRSAAPLPSEKSAGALEAYPALDAPKQVAPGSAFDVHIGFSAAADPSVAHTGKMVFPDVRPTDQCLLVLVADGVEVDRMHEVLPLRIDARATFHCQAPAADSVATVKAQYFFRNHLVGIGVRRITISSGGANADLSTPPPPPSSIRFPGPDEPLDMTVTVNHLKDGQLQWSWTAPNPGIQTTEPFFKELKEAARFAADMVRDLKAWNFTGVYAANILDNRGQAVSGLIPKQFFADLRRVYDAVGRLPTLLLITNETYVPWELALVPDRFDKEAPQFLAAQTCMGRWLSDEDVAHPPAVVVDILESTAVAAEYTEDSLKPLLLEALAERKHLAEQWSFAPVEADADQLQPYVIGPSKRGHLIHFALHGLSDPTANNQVLILADGRQLQASALAGKRDPAGPPRFAFVFLNACQVGMAGADFGQAAGFPGLLVHAGVHGFIAPLWTVDDGLARGIAERFYQATLGENSPVGHALQEQRARYQPKHSTTELAYVYYGNPALRLRYTRPKT